MKRSKLWPAATLLAVLAASVVLLLAALLAGAPSVFAQCIVPPNGAVVKTTSYAAAANDTGKLIVMNCATACTLTLPATPQSPVWVIWASSIGAGVASVSPNGLNLDGSSATVAIPLGVGSSLAIWTDNSNYFSARGSVPVMQSRVARDIAIGDASASALTNAQLGPQKRLILIPANATLLELDVSADAGTPNVIVGRNRAGTVVNIVSSALATASAGGIACANVGGTTGIDGATTCSGTLQNTALNAGDYLELVSGTAGGTAKLMTVHVVYTVN